MRWFKKIVRAILALLPVFSIFFICNGSSYALKYDYKGIPWSNSYLPGDGCYSLNSDNKYYFDSTNSACRDGSFTASSQSLRLNFAGDSYDQDFITDVSLKSSQSQLSFYDNGDFRFVYPIFTRDYSSYNNQYYSVSSNLLHFYDVDHIWSSSYLPSTGNYLRFNKKFGEANLPNFNLNSINATDLLSCNSIGTGSPGTSYWNSANGAVCPGFWNTREFVSDQILDYPYSSSGFYRYSSAISVDGTTYSNTFSFTDLFDRVVTKFSSLQIPLADMESGYFYDYRNIYSGRHFKFAGSFQFDGSFAWHSNIDTTGYFGINIDGYSRDSGQYISERHDCSSNLVTVSGYKLLEYSCEFDLSNNYIYLNPVLLIGNNIDFNHGGIDFSTDYVWLTDNDWRFYTSYLVTDNDDTPGGAFNSVLTGGGSIPGDAQNLIPGGNSVETFFSSLVNLFGFTFINPFAGIFSLFTDNSTCASIPTLSGMLHAEETHVCPWFDSTTRNIVTPVLGLASVMLLVGFVVRWLGARSGNLSEDSVETDNFKFANKYRRNK